MNRKPVGFWDKKENRIRATKNLIKQLKKPINEIRYSDFKNNGLSILIRKSKGFRLALKEAGYQKNLKLKRKAGYWEIKKNRIKSVRKLVSQLNKPVMKISYSDFTTNGLSGILYQMQLPEVLLEAGYNVKPKTPKPGEYWNRQGNRIKETKKLVNKLEKKLKI
jgi:hypothetical protein